MEALLRAVKWDAQGLVPAVVQDASSKEVLMMAYMNEESLKLTVESGETWYWSRSRSELWHKGATSGHIQKVRSLRYDCDGDTLLVLVDQTGPACHTGQYSCFHNEVKAGALAGGEAAAVTVAGQADRFAMLSKLESVIAQRDAERPEGAYTTYLFEKGVDKILKKVGEETAEVIIAAKNKDNDELRCEASDLIFHLMVLLRERKLPLDDVLGELDKRHNTKK
ncbi:bifunctional phosphoribosyl-AMP cyclohydrolase/phosphoribosyl-ATP diphosphatase HisIE [Paenibacillus filicis]|uniref:Histidine biosynthesis bifunctional protein HisIE n=1 Tax=Paenibacillus gyeongsangnamensis TaxID=3388067 RepID=A0ABT4QAR8_9BACL|nr:bifunctional phosphoribosyl-AMP cyclohydrolase/phosphoribosyl-ATP diphosphatase HisIE [Paenibacillus filicis]MCZ8513914.1 bifunctional phosphoribosyl-AMP cyclohydrolase/phosphoribosyl-ATP diphosphatase HisIE [Paenibacillus filicis]